jgi:hypothetical protein
MWNFRERLLWDGLTGTIFLSYYKMNKAWLSTGQAVLLANFRLLQLETARQLYEVEHGSPLANLDLLTPDIIDLLPADPFAEGEPFKMVDRTIYSIGPDKVDDQGLIFYDPTNGTISNDDTYFDADRMNMALSFGR